MLEFQGANEKDESAIRIKNEEPRARSSTGKEKNRDGLA